MKVRSFLLLISSAVLAGGVTASSALTAGSGCLKCHGDAAVLKALVKPAAAGASEGEG